MDGWENTLNGVQTWVVVIAFLIVAVPVCALAWCAWAAVVLISGWF